MLFGDSGKEKRMVEAIEEGKIVRVPEDYATREELPVLRKIDIELKASSRANSKAKKEDAERDRYGVDEFRKPLKWGENDIGRDLVNNFHWEISRARRKRNLTRKQFAEILGESENTVKMIENGILPANDFILVNKIQSSLGLNLRKDGFDSEKSARAAVEENKPLEKETARVGDSLGLKVSKGEVEEDSFEKELFSDDIEIIDED